jgi:ribonuclease E
VVDFHPHFSVSGQDARPAPEAPADAAVFSDAAAETQPEGAAPEAVEAPRDAAMFSDAAAEPQPEGGASEAGKTGGEEVVEASAEPPGSAAPSGEAPGTRIEGEAEGETAAEFIPSVPVAAMVEERPQKPVRTAPPRKGWWQRRS